MESPRAGKPEEAAPVKFLAALLMSRGFDPEAGLFPKLESILGEIDYRSASYPFTVTDYYEEEMGPGLHRVIVSFAPLRPATDIVRVKLDTAAVEKTYERKSGRIVNIDPGYIDYYKVVLASFKEGPQKIYLGEGVYADPVLLFQHGVFESLPWTFPDFTAGLYTNDLMEIRRIYKKARRWG